MDAPFKTGITGFTLLEALVALTITAFLLSGVYQVINRSVIKLQILEQRAETLHAWIHLRRILNKDLEHLIKESPTRNVLEEPARIVPVDKETLILRCTGDIIPDWRLGLQVEVIYRWKENTTKTGLVWERLVQPMGSNRENAMLTLRIDQDLGHVEYALFDTKEWHLFGESTQLPWSAIRWRFDWQNMGEWHLVKSLQPPTGMRQVPHP
ncbi:MAG: prepilin-type N-terminal cleavage/methylation domain-containing protein [Magnetococcus sp. DMHC-1]